MILITALLLLSWTISSWSLCMCKTMFVSYLWIYNSVTMIAIFYILRKDAAVHTKLCYMHDTLSQCIEQIPVSIMLFNQRSQCILMNQYATSMFGTNIHNLFNLIRVFENNKKAINLLQSIHLSHHSGSEIITMYDDQKGIMQWYIHTAILSNRHYIVSIVDLSNNSIEECNNLENNNIIFRDIVHNSAIGYLVTNNKNEILFYNRMLAKWSGFSMQGMIGKNIADILIQVSNDTEVNDISITTYKPTAMLLSNPENTQEIIVSKILNTEKYRTYAVIQNDNNLLHSEIYEYIEKGFNDAPIAIAIIKNNKIFGCNACFINEICNTKNDHILACFSDPKNKKVLEAGLKAAKLNELVDPFEITLSNTTWSVHIKQIVHDHDITKNAIIYFINITNSKKLETHLEHSQKMQSIGQLVYNIVHDLNNILTAIIGSCDLLWSRYLPHETSFTDVINIKQNAQRATEIIKRLLRSIGHKNEDRSDIDAVSLINRMSFMLRILLGAKIKLSVKYNDGTYLITADSIQIEQVIMNIVVNARDEMKNGGHLTIEVDRFFTDRNITISNQNILPGKYITIAIKDTGNGIPDEIMNNIFEPFFSTKSESDGVGLGLSIVYNIVQQHQGIICVESTIGQGTTFTIYLPQSNSTNHLEIDDDKNTAHHNPALTGSNNVLLVEDDESVGAVIARSLRNNGYNVIVSVDAKTAESIWKTHNIDIMITDVVMPDIDGPVLATMARKTLPELKILLMSGHTEEMVKKEFEIPENVYFIQKPFTIKDITAKLALILEKK